MVVFSIVHVFPHNSFVINSDTIDIGLIGGSSITFRSADRKILTVSPNINQVSCGPIFSLIGLASAITQTVALSVGDTCSVGGGGGGGGGGGSLPTPTPTPTPTATPIPSASPSATVSPSPTASVSPSATLSPSASPVSSANAALIATLQQQINALIAQLKTLIQQKKAAGESIPASLEAFLNASPNASFNRNLTLGSIGDDVKALQQLLNSKGFKVAISGAGSPGFETTRFGPATKAALAKYQQSVGIKPASGYFGFLTRNYLKSVGY